MKHISSVLIFLQLLCSGLTFADETYSTENIRSWFCGERYSAIFKGKFAREKGPNIPLKLNEAFQRAIQVQSSLCKDGVMLRAGYELQSSSIRSSADALKGYMSFERRVFANKINSYEESQQTIKELALFNVATKMGTVVYGKIQTSVKEANDGHSTLATGPAPASAAGMAPLKP